jgi:hypothetical protein
LNPIPLLCTAGPVTILPLSAQNGGFHFIAPSLPPGVYRVAAVFDASGFDWERLWWPMHRFANAGQRTGPWDFDFDHIEPVVPAWWIELNGRRLGLTAVRRPGPADVLNKRMWLNFCFELHQSGDAEVRMVPFNQADLRPLQFRLEPLAEEVPAPVRLRHEPATANWGAWQVRTEVWEKWRRTVRSNSDLDRLMRRIIQQLAEAAPSQRPAPGEEGKQVNLIHLQPMDEELLPLLGYLHRTGEPLDALGMARRIIEQCLNREHWGNPNPAGYGCDGDMAAAGMLQSLSTAYHWFGQDLDTPERALRDELLIRLGDQMGRFRRSMLLWWDYWGGSVMQDHGFRSVARYGVAAINLLGLIPEAEHHLAAAAARVRRTLAAMPPDGAIPFSSYHKLHLYMDDLVGWRDAFGHAAGEDIFEHPAFNGIVDYVANRLHEPTMEMMVANSRGDRSDFFAGWGYLAARMSLRRDERAARLIELLLERYGSGEKKLPLRPLAAIPALLGHFDLSVKPAPLDRAQWDCRRDSGQVSYRPAGADACVAVRCGGSGGSGHTFVRSSSPCDQITDVFMEGHFTVHLGERVVLATAEGGYRMRGGLGCTLLIDGQGGFGDMDFAMGTPALGRRNHHIEVAEFDPVARRGFLRMDLAPGYAREAQLLRYVRELVLEPDGLLCRDMVVSAADHAFSWHFHTHQENPIEAIEDNAWRFTAGDRSLTLAGRGVEEALRSSTGPTEVVWAYGNENKSRPFSHVRFETKGRQRAMTAEFQVDWGP